MADTDQDKSDVKSAVFSFLGKKKNAHVVDLPLEQNHEIRNSKTDFFQRMNVQYNDTTWLSRRYNVNQEM